jgi:hypothetical protein
MQPVTALPDASEEVSGVLFFVLGEAGAADGLYVCMKNPAGDYIWQSLT